MGTFWAVYEKLPLLYYSIPVHFLNIYIVLTYDEVILPDSLYDIVRSNRLCSMYCILLITICEAVQNSRFKEQNVIQSLEVPFSGTFFWVRVRVRVCSAYNFASHIVILLSATKYHAKYPIIQVYLLSYVFSTSINMHFLFLIHLYSSMTC